MPEQESIISTRVKAKILLSLIFLLKIIDSFLSGICGGLPAGTCLLSLNGRLIR